MYRIQYKQSQTQDKQQDKDVHSIQSRSRRNSLLQVAELRRKLDARATPLGRVAQLSGPVSVVLSTFYSVPSITQGISLNPEIIDRAVTDSTVSTKALMRSRKPNIITKNELKRSHPRLRRQSLVQQRLVSEALKPPSPGIEIAQIIPSATVTTDVVATPMQQPTSKTNTTRTQLPFIPFIPMGLDRGGTFTDVIGINYSNKEQTIFATKVLSTDFQYQNCPLTKTRYTSRLQSSTMQNSEKRYTDLSGAIRRILNLKPCEELPADTTVRIGTTLGTNALLERKGSKCIYITTLGFGDALLIRHQTRQDIFALNVKRPKPLYHYVIEVHERISAKGDVIVPLDNLSIELLTRQLKDLKDNNPDIESVAVALLHSCIYPNHEVQIGSMCKNLGFQYVYLSHQTEPIPKFIPRAETTVVDAYLTPILSQYTTQISNELGNISTSDFPNLVPHVANNFSSQLFCMKSDGGLANASFFKGRDSLLSGPSGGVVGALKVCAAKGIHKVISFDMGGTSTDVSHLHHGLRNRIETDVGGITLCRTSVDVNTVAAGGGSIIRFDGSRLIVGPQSASSNPGPACYRQGGPLTITDCNVILGRVQPSVFPNVFGPNGDESLDAEIVKSKFDTLQQEIIKAYLEDQRKSKGTDDSSTHYYCMKEIFDPVKANIPNWMETVEGIAEQFIEIACQQMATAIKQISSHRGIYIGDHTLCCFGGAGGQVCCQLAAMLGLQQIFIHPLASVLSAVGIGLADITSTAQSSVGLELTQNALNEEVDPIIRRLAKNVCNELELQNIPIQLQTLNVQLRLGYRGTDTVLVVDYYRGLASVVISQNSSKECNRTAFKQHKDFKQSGSFHEAKDKKSCSHTLSDTSDCILGQAATSLREEFCFRHHREFGFTLSKEHPIDIVSFEVQSAMSETHCDKTLLGSKIVIVDKEKVTPKNEMLSECKVFISGKWYNVPLLHLWKLPVPGEVVGPAVMIDSISTNFVLPGWKAKWDEQRCLLLQLCQESECIGSFSRSRPSNLRIADAFWLELFNHYFKSVAEEMGIILRQTSQSVNIKERLDFSCAIFDANGSLIANAPHIPVHLGSMGDSVQSLIEYRNGIFHPGEVFASNNPFNGGTHLPDITVITPVFVYDHCNANERLVPFAFVASRGHHADIGGIAPGSMPSSSRTLVEEGVIFDNLLIVDSNTGEFLAEPVMKTLLEAPYPARNPSLNLADLQAQIAANRRGVEELRKGVHTFGLDALEAYAQHILDGGEKALRRVIRDLSLLSCDLKKHSFVLHMDDDKQIQVTIAIDRLSESAVLDFSGTSPTDPLNFNAPISILKAAVLYVFRTLINDNSIPLNQGCFRPLNLCIPKDSIINPRHNAAVAAGNVEISQCIVNSLYGCLGCLAAGQGTMNNVVFGNSRFQYYETICGGTGAGSSFDGCSAIHSHMTNSRITDPEVFELRLPVLILRFGIRHGTGGKGKYTGGDGVCRSFCFLDNVECSILSSNRDVHPFGLNGGHDGAMGRNTLFSIRKDFSTSLEDLRRPLQAFMEGEVSSEFDSQIKDVYAMNKLKGRDSCSIRVFDVLQIETPGGGGFGSEDVI